MSDYYHSWVGWHSGCTSNEENSEEGSMGQKNEHTEAKTNDSQEEIIATLINPIHVFSGAVSPKDYINAQKQLIRDFGEDIYFNWQLEILHAEIASIIEEIRLENSGPRPNTNVVGEA
jgi:hypothetical protein